MPDVKEIVVSALLEAGEHVAPKEALAKLSDGDDFSIDELGLESLDMMQVIMHIEEAFDIELEVGDLSDQTTLGALVAFVSREAGDQ